MRQRWEAGDLGCGQFVIELHRQVGRLQPGGTLEVVVENPGARADVPAWCRMTGHRLVSEDHPVYVIERRASD